MDRAPRPGQTPRGGRRSINESRVQRFRPGPHGRHEPGSQFMEAEDTQGGGSDGGGGGGGGGGGLLFKKMDFHEFKKGNVAVLHEQAESHYAV